MGDVIYLLKDQWQERSCSKCGGMAFLWFTGADDECQHILECDDCGTEHCIYGEEVAGEDD